MTDVIALSGLGVQLGGRPVLRGLTVNLSGRAIGLLGPNGAGKTTLIHTLLGFHQPSGGTARMLGEDIRMLGPAARAQVGYMPERESFIAGMSAVQFVSYMAALSGLPRVAALERAHEALHFVGLGEARYRDVATFSLGMKQMVKLAQAIAHGPRLIFLDEPTNGLDPRARRRMLELVQQIRDSGEAHIVLSSHLLNDVEQVCDEALVLKDGAIAAHVDLAAERQQNRRFVELEIGPLPARPLAPRAGQSVDRSDDGDPNTDSRPGQLAGQVGDGALAAARAAFAEGAAALGCEYALAARDRLKLVLPEAVGVHELYVLAGRQGVSLRRLTYRRDSLHDIFMKAMEAPGR